jgi:hypothetical protein
MRIGHKYNIKYTDIRRKQLNKSFFKDKQYIENNIILFNDIMPSKYTDLIFLFYSIGTNDAFNLNAQSIKLSVDPYQVLDLIINGLNWFKKQKEYANN